MATGGRATRATASGRSAATLERSTVGFGSDDYDAMTRRRSGESRDDGGRAARWAAARAGDGRGGDTEELFYTSVSFCILSVSFFLLGHRRGLCVFCCFWLVLLGVVGGV